MKYNLVSIIIPCYNQGDFMAETLLSVFNQQYTHWECLLIDDGSTDDTAKVIEEWTQKDNRFHYYKKENSGVSDTRNFGLQKVKGEYIQFLDADDLLATDKISLSIEAIKKYKVEVVCSNYLVFASSPSITEQPFSYLANFEFNFNNLARYWNDGFTVPPHCWFFKASLFENILFPKGLTAQEDWVVWLLIFKKLPKTFYSPKHLAFYRRNPNGRTNTGGMFNETLQAINYLKPFLNESEFQILYEGAITRYNSGILYWRNREATLKKSDTYQFGLLCKKILLKISVLPIAKSIFQKLTK